MGDIKKLKKTYDRPRKPWEKERIIEEKELKKKYGYKNKQEIWRFNALLRGFRQQAREIFASDSPQKKKEGENLKAKLFNMALLEKDSTFDGILGLTIDDISKRRLLSLVLSKGFARTPKQARQFITHKHVSINGKKITSPNYIVLRDEESGIEFSENSCLKNDNHPLIESMKSISKGNDEKIIEEIKKEAKKDGGKN